MPFVFIKHAIAANSISFVVSSFVYVRKNDTSNSNIVLSACNKTLWQSMIVELLQVSVIFQWLVTKRSTGKVRT